MISETTSLLITITVVCALAACISMIVMEMYNMSQEAVMLSNVHVRAWSLGNSVYVENDGPLPVVIKYVVVGDNIVEVNTVLRSHRALTLSQNATGVGVCLPGTSLCKIVPVEPSVLLYSASSATKSMSVKSSESRKSGPVPLRAATVHHYVVVRRHLTHSSSNENVYELLKKELEKKAKTGTKHENAGKVKPLSMNEAITIVQRTKLYGRYVWVPKVPVTSINNCGHEVVCLDIGSYNPSSYSWG